MNPKQILERGGGIVGGTIRTGARIGRSALSGTFGIFQQVRRRGGPAKPEWMT